MKLAIGTANLGRKYGLLKNKIPNKNEFECILSLAKNNKIEVIDTAFDYKILEKLKKLKNLNKFKFITKVKLPKKNKKIFIKNLKNKIIGDLKKLKISSYEAILIHDTEDLKLKISNNLISLLKNFKSLKLTKKLGVSIYDPKELKLVLTKFKPDIVQVPINIFDNRFINSNWFSLLKEKKIQIQARSIFLQGVLTKNLSQLNRDIKNKKLLKKILLFDNWCNLNNITRLEACIQFIKSIKGINILTFGINNNADLKEIIKLIKKKNTVIKNFSTNDKTIIDPRKW